MTLRVKLLINTLIGCNVFHYSAALGVDYATGTDMKNVIL